MKLSILTNCAKTLMHLLAAPYRERAPFKSLSKNSDTMKHANSYAAALHERATVAAMTASIILKRKHPA